MNEELSQPVTAMDDDEVKESGKISYACDKETKDLVKRLREETGLSAKELHKAMVTSYRVRHLTEAVPSVSIQTDNLVHALDVIRESFSQVVDGMTEYENNVKKDADEKIAEADERRSHMEEELAEEKKRAREAREECDRMARERDQAREIAQAKSDLADSLRDQVLNLQDQVTQMSARIEDQKRIIDLSTIISKKDEDTKKSVS